MQVSPDNIKTQALRAEKAIRYLILAINADCPQEHTTAIALELEEASYNLSELLNGRDPDAPRPAAPPLEAQIIGTPPRA